MSARDNERDVLTYSLLTASEDSQYFRMNSSTGVISSARTIDREVMDSLLLASCQEISIP